MNKFFCIILAFFTGLFTYPVSFLPGNADTDFDIAEGDFFTLNGETAEITVDGNYDENSVLNLTKEKLTIRFEDTSADWFNYYGLSYSSDAYIKGEITYNAGIKQKTEEFFLEPSDNRTFYSFIDNCLSGTKANMLHSVSFQALNTDNATVKITGMATFNREVPAEEIFIKNDTPDVVIDYVYASLERLIEVQIDEPSCMLEMPALI